MATPSVPTISTSTSNAPVSRASTATPTATSPSIPSTTFLATSTPTTFTSTYGAHAYVSGTTTGTANVGMFNHLGQRVPMKRGRKPKNAILGGGVGGTPGRPVSTATSTFSTPGGTSTAGGAQSGSGTGGYSVHWALPTGAGAGESGSSAAASTSTAGPQVNGYTPPATTTSTNPGAGVSTTPRSSYSTLDSSGLLTYSAAAAGGSTAAGAGGGTPRLGPTVPGVLAGVGPAGHGEDDVEADDDMLPAMADDDYSAGLSWQSQSKDNLKVLMDNFSPSQYDRFEAYRRHALPKQAVRKVIQQTTGQQVSQPVAQIVAGFSKVFVGEIVEKARQVQARKGETGPLSPDHLREAYRLYQEETGRVGAARPVRSKRLFVR